MKEASAAPVGHLAKDFPWRLVRSRAQNKPLDSTNTYLLHGVTISFKEIRRDKFR